ncbi:dihydroorotate oxidase [Enterococcus nangangensis]|uniref:dihydroorotate oxidase n=1 Tax=Enterococcus nangangensis TaxID=2559926 RepID=UPI0010F79073|nr:dihydroorotate oxidase [Enterococcus nangangensis]
MNLATNFFDYPLENCLMNASGVHCMEVSQLEELAASMAATYVTKTATMAPRLGNPEPRYRDLPQGSINSMGLPNHGLPYYLAYLEKAAEKEPQQLIFCSLVGMTTSEIFAELKMVQESSFNGFTELNLSCPNVPGKPQVAYDFALTDKILAEAFTFFKKPLGIKLPPYFDLAHFDEMAEILNRYPIKYVNCINSIGNGLVVDLATEAAVIKPKGGFGGLGGAMVKATALANVRAFRERLRPDIAVIGTGGVTSGADVFEHLLCGASLVQVGTQLHQEGPAVFQRLLTELAAIMKEKGYQSIAEFQGKLQTL